jgi:teichuronic acid biosynthesis glycosyltransferase TuaG
MSVHDPKVSVVMPAHNAAATLTQSMRSVLAQSMSDLELLVIDDGSTDDTLAIARAMAVSDARVVVLEMQTNSGAGEARNAGLDAARGEFIAFLDSDDRWVKNKLERQLPLFDESAILLVGSGYGTIDTQGKVLGGIGAVERFDVHDLLRGEVLGCLTSVFRRAALRGTRFRPKAARSCGWLGRTCGWLPIQEDYLFWLDLFAANPGASGRNVSERLAYYMLRPASASAGKHRAAYFHWHILRHDVGLPWFEAASYFVQYAVASLRKSKQYRANTIIAA